MCGNIPLDVNNGSIIKSSGLKIGYFAQHFGEQLNINQTPVEYLLELFPNVDYQYIRKTLGTFGLESKHHISHINTLSGGQKNRVIFSKLALSNPDILYLDEPTNHLDVESIDALGEALSLENFKGAVIVVSHDLQLIDKICENGEIWVLGKDKNINVYDGDIYDYCQELIESFL